MSTVTTPPTRTVTGASVANATGSRAGARTIVASGWYDPDGAAWEPDLPFEAPVATRTSARPPIRVGAASGPRRS